MSEHYSEKYPLPKLPEGTDVSRKNIELRETTNSSAIEQGIVGREQGIALIDEVVNLALNEPSPANPVFSIRNEIEEGRSYAMCRTFSAVVQEFLNKEGYNARIVHSNDPDNNTHQYVIVGIGSTEIIVDPSIGQFIQGHNKPFIGTRDELKKLVLDSPLRYLFILVLGMNRYVHFRESGERNQVGL